MPDYYTNPHTGQLTATPLSCIGHPVRTPHGEALIAHIGIGSDGHTHIIYEVTFAGSLAELDYLGRTEYWYEADRINFIEVETS